MERSVPEDPLARSARGVYGISVASELSGIDPQTLRLYERRGLLAPARTDGGTRRYSDADLDLLARISDLVAQGINIAGIAQILHLQHRNTELESDNSDLKSENARLRSGKPTKGKEDGKPMTNCPDDTPLADDVDAADAAEQHQPAADSAEDAGLDPRCVADLLKRDANPSDVIDQAIIVPLPDDDPDTDVTAF
jgi:MerR family transcriptional regulator, heat shock protein HspR